MIENAIGEIVIDAAIMIHTELGHRLLETVYEVVLAYDSRKECISRIINGRIE